MNVVEITHTEKRFHTLNVKFTKQELKILNTGKFNFELIPYEERCLPWQKRTFEVEKIVEAILTYFDTTIEDIKRNSRVKLFVDIRMYLSYYLRKYTRLSIDDIGKIMNRDHATVIHMTKRMKTEMFYKDAQEMKKKIDSMFLQLNVA